VTPDAPGPEPARLPATVRGLSLVSLGNDLASEMVYPLLPALVTALPGGGAAALGALDGAADLAGGGIRWISGRLADRPGWRFPLIRWGYAVAVAVRPLIATAGAAWQVIGLRVTDRLGKGLRSPARDALIAGVTPPSLHGRAFGFHRAADHLGAVLGALAAWGLLAAGQGVRDVILWSAVPGLLVLLVLHRALIHAAREQPATSSTRPVRPANDPRPPVRDVDARGRTFWVPAAALAVLMGGRMPETLLLLRLQDLGTSVATVPLVWAGLHVVRSVAAWPGGWLTDRVGSSRTLLGGGLLLSAVLALFGGATGTWGGILVFLGFGVVSGLMESAERAAIAGLAPIRTGRAFGAYQGSVALLALPVGVGYGVLYQVSGGDGALHVAAVVVGGASLAWWRFGR